MLKLTTHSTPQTHVYEVELQSPTQIICGLSSGVVLLLGLALALALTAASAPLLLLLPAWAACGTALLASLLHVTKERLTVLHGMGVLLESHMRCGVRSHQQFVDLKHVASVLINEGVTTHDIRYYLAFELRHGMGLAVAFPRLLPRLHLLRPVYREVHDLIESELRGDVRSDPQGTQGARAAGT